MNNPSLVKKVVLYSYIGLLRKMHIDWEMNTAWSRKCAVFIHWLKEKNMHRLGKINMLGQEVYCIHTLAY